MSCHLRSVAPVRSRFFRRFAEAESFPQTGAIQCVKGFDFFHMLKTPWRKLKSPALKPVLPVEFHSFHQVFNNRPSLNFTFSLQFVIFKTEL